MATRDQLIIRIGGNIDDLKKALAEGRVLIDNTSTSLGRMTASLRGDKMLAEAQKVVQAVQAAGGAAVLTEREQAKVNAQLTVAIEKYRLLGKEAPVAMRELEQATRRAETATGQAEQKVSLLSGVSRQLGPIFAATFSVAAIVRFGEAMMENADALVRLSDKTGIAIEPLQGLQYAAKQSGLELDTVTSAVSMMQKRLANGDDSALSALSRLGIAFGDFKDLAPDQQFIAIAQEVAKIEDPMLRTKAATDLFGKGGAEVLALLVANVKELSDEAPKMSEAAVRALDAVGDASARALARFRAGVVNIVGGHLAEIYQGIDNIRALVRDDGSLDWRVAVAGDAGNTPRLRAAPVKNIFEPISPVGGRLQTDRDIEALYRQSDALEASFHKQAKAVDLLKVSYHDWNGSVVGTVDVLDELSQPEMHNVLAGFARDGLLLSETFADQLDPNIYEATNRTKEIQAAVEAAHRPTVEWTQRVRGLSESFRQLAQTSGSSGLGQVAQFLANVTGGIAMGSEAAAGFSDGLDDIGKGGKTAAQGILGVAMAAAQAVAAMDQATQSTSRWQNALAGAATGASVGANPALMGATAGWSVAVGAGVGALYGASKDTPGNDVSQAIFDQWAASHGGMQQLERDLELARANMDLFNEAVAAGADDMEAYRSAVAALDAQLLAAKKQMDAYRAAAVGTKTLADTLGVSSTQAQFERLGIYVSAIFGRILRESGSLAEALAVVSDTLDAMLAAGTQFGFTPNGALSELVGLRSILTNNPNLAGRITGLGQIAQGLGPGLLKSMNLAPTLGADLSDTYKDLVGPGGASQSQALLLMQGPLQTLWEAVKQSPQLRRTMDEATLALLKLAEEQGFVGADMREVSLRQLDVLTQIRDLLAGTPTSPGDEDWSPRTPGVPPTDGRVGRRDDRRFANGSGGFQWFGSGTPAMLHGWEAVVRPQDVAPGVGGGAPIVIHVHTNLDGREVARNQVRYIPGQLAAAGL